MLNPKYYVAASLLGLSMSAATLVQSAECPSATTDDFRNECQTASEQFTYLAPGLSVSYLTRESGQDSDQISFWPYGSNNPTHAMTCVEEVLGCLSGACGADFVLGDKLTPGVQVTDLASGEITTILRGMTICDGIRTTPWGTVVATEEDFVSDDGSVYEILNPLDGNEYTILKRDEGGVAANIVDQDGNNASAAVIKRTAMPVIRYEGLYVDESGVVIAGDEERPGSYNSGDTDGGAIYKFVPSNPREPGQGPISSLDESPLVAGSIYAMQVSCRDDRQQYGQGCEIGNGAWIPLEQVEGRIGRESAYAAGATGYYRPEDLHRDPMYSDPENPAAVRFCFANTGNKGGKNFGEVQCAIDKNINGVDIEFDSRNRRLTGQIVINRFIEGDADLNQPDNLAFQPKTGNLFVIEDNSGTANIWGCLRDGADRDVKSDGCIRMLTVADPSAEPTGLIFDPSGEKAYVYIQHSSDGNMPLVDDFRTDDMIVIEGFRTRTSKRDFGTTAQKLLNVQGRSLFGFGGER